MRRAIQILSVLLVLLLGTGPAWAALSCASGPAMDASCPMGTAAMDADCPMTHSLAVPDCSQDCCDQRMPTADVLSAMTAKPDPLKVLLHEHLVVALQTAEGRSQPVVLMDRAWSSPPRYILLRVFRI